MKSEYRCLICGEKYGSHITAVHKLFQCFPCLKKPKDAGIVNVAFKYDDDDEILLIENN